MDPAVLGTRERTGEDEDALVRERVHVRRMLGRCGLFEGPGTVPELRRRLAAYLLEGGRLAQHVIALLRRAGMTLALYEQSPQAPVYHWPA